MLRIIAMIGDAEASAHVRSAVAGAARLELVRDLNGLVREVRIAPPEVIVLGTRETAFPDVRVAVRQILRRYPATRLIAISALEPSDVRILHQPGHLDLSDIIFIRVETRAMARKHLLEGDAGRHADLHVCNVVCPLAHEWLRPYLVWCATHDSGGRRDVRSMAKVGRIRRETLARRCRAAGVCRPNHLISWLQLLRAVARMQAGLTLDQIARELGLPSGCALANLFVRRSGQTSTQVRERGFADFADDAVRAMFGRWRTRGNSATR